MRFLLRRITWGFSIHENVIYLTFDDGPHPDITPWILDILQTQNWKATFFCVGENVVKYPEIFQRILDEGHAVGNHTMKHENALNTKPADYLKSIYDAGKRIPSVLFRPPYGKLTPLLLKRINKTHKVVLWSYMTYDFDSSVPEQVIIDKFRSGFKKGDIIVLHDNPKFKDRQQLIFPALVEILKEKQYVSRAIDLSD